MLQYVQYMLRGYCEGERWKGEEGNFYVLYDDLKE